MSEIYHPPKEHGQLSVMDEGLLRAVACGEARLTVEQGLELFRATGSEGGMSLPALGRWADARCRSLHGDRIRTYIIDRNINYTNVCTARCTFCAFRRDHEDADAYTLSKEQIHEKIAELVGIGGTQILMQGGMNDRLPLSWYEELLSSIKERFPGVHVHAFSPPEMVEFVHFFDPPGADFAAKVRWVLERLQRAGLDSLPGGGGEIFADPVRRKIGLGKCDAESWLTVMHEAQSLGMFTSATMMFGHVEGYADRVHHLWLVREWQDKALRAGGVASPAAGRGEGGFGHYKAFISWPFQRENTPLGHVPEWGSRAEEVGLEFPGDAMARAWDFGRGVGRHPAGQRSADVFDAERMDKERYPTAALFGKRVRMSGSSDYLRTQAISRLFLDNVYSIGASWVTMGPQVGQAGLMYGANDMGSVMMEENVVSSAGTTYCLDEAVICRLIREAGFIPAQRDNAYDVLKVQAGADAPDLRVTDWSRHRARRLHVETASRRVEASLTVSGKR